MTKLHPEIEQHVLPVPVDFQPEFEEKQKFIRWQHVLRRPGEAPMVFELGMRRSQGTDAEIRLRLRSEAWQILELIRLGHMRMVEHARQDRHKKDRPVSKPGLWVPTPAPVVN